MRDSLRPAAVAIGAAALEDLDCFGSQLGVEQGKVLVRELAGRMVELGVADLAVFGFLEGLEIGRDGGPPAWPPRRPDRDQRSGEGNQAADPDPGDQRVDD